MSLADGNASALAQALLGAGHPIKIPEFMADVTLAGTHTMTSQMRNIQKLDPGGAGRTVLLPPEEDGLWYWFVNAADAAENLTVKEDSNTTTIVTINQNESAVVCCMGTSWKLVAVVAIALS